MSYIAYRADIKLWWGFFASRDTLATHDIQVTVSSCKLAACYICPSDHSSLIACSVYCPPSSDRSYLAELW